ncbi:hypothetical protein J2X68_007949 [Streptomyces sp. 3330]|nr:hypothetical protein [Streptomyces sp. 3330]
MNVQVVTDPAGEVLWISPALPGRTHDLTAARSHHIIRICERQGVPILADRAYQGAAPGSPPDSNARRAVNSPSPSAPPTGSWPQLGHLSNAVWHD